VEPNFGESVLSAPRGWVLQAFRTHGGPLIVLLEAVVLNFPLLVLLEFFSFRSLVAQGPARQVQLATPSLLPFV
jgi:hypothetical protein